MTEQTQPEELKACCAAAYGSDLVGLLLGDSYHPGGLALTRRVADAPGAGRFIPAPLTGEDYTSFVLREVASTGWKVHARIAVDAPADQVLSRINPAVGVVETIDENHSVLVTGADSLETVAVWIGMLGLDFHVTDPPELVEHLRVLADRHARALPATDGRI